MAMTAAPDYVPVYDGEVVAIAHMEEHGWTVWHELSGFGHFTNPVAIHPTNPASPMSLRSFEVPTRRGSGPILQFWWRPMHQIPNVGIKWARHRIRDYLPGRTRYLYGKERLP